MKSGTKGIITVIVILSVFAIVGLSLMLRNTAKEWSFNELKDAIDRGEVAEVSVHNDIVSVKTGNSKKYNYQTYVQQNVAEWNIYDTVPEKVNNPDGTPRYENTVQYAILKKEWDRQQPKQADSPGGNDRPGCRQGKAL